MVDMSEMITARNTEDGSVGRYPRKIVEHQVLGKYLEEVPFGTKPRVTLKAKVESSKPAPVPAKPAEKEED